MADTHTCPLPRSKVIDLYFFEHRAKLLDIAAFLDRVERAKPESNDADFRITAMNRAIGVLLDGKPERARRIQELFSDHTTGPIDRAPMKGAMGAVP
jgi:hypothetical protein